MADRFDKRTRSKIMSKIKGKNTSIEVLFRKALYARGFRGYRIHPKMLGNPDLAFIGKRVVVFVDGDFWHGYNWKILGKVPPKEYWQGKIERNIERDKKHTEQLQKEGWTVLRFWEHEIKDDLDSCIVRVKETAGG